MKDYEYNYRQPDCYWAEGDMPDKVISDSVKAIEGNKANMTSEQQKRAYTQLKLGSAPDGYSQLCDRKSSDSFQ